MSEIVNDSPTTTEAGRRFGSGTAVVTGGGAGIGEGFVRYLATIGMRVVVVDIDGGRAAALAEELSSQGSSVIAHQLDVTEPDELERLASEVFEKFGSVELLVNNAGLETGGLLWDVTVDRWKRLMSVNVDGVYFGIRAFVPRMIQAGKPAVIANVSSVGGLTTAPLQAPYIVSKHAVLALTECLHQEIAFVGAPIQVSAVLPYSIRSQIFLDAQKDEAKTDGPANRVFDYMQAANVSQGLDPIEGAERMMAAIAAGDFWVFSDDVMGKEAVKQRVDLLEHLGSPPDPWPRLAEKGVTR